jgi:hypothetical protein
MMKISKFLLPVAGVLAILIAACGSATPAPPTQSPEMIYTQVASTIQAAVSETAAALPTSTSTPEAPPTAIPTPTLPPLPTVDQTLASVPTVVLPPTTQAPVPTQPGSNTGDHAILGYQSPADHSSFSPGDQIPLTFGFLNTGTTTWTAKCYTLKWFGGTQIWGETTLKMPKDTKPNEKAEFNIAAFMPQDKGDYISRWGLYNCSNALFYEVYFAFTVK